MALTTPLAFEFISGVLRGDATLMALGTALGGLALSDGVRVYRDGFVPQGARFPMVILAAIVPAIPVKVIGDITVWSDVIMAVKCIDKDGAMANQIPITSRIDALLKGAAGTVVGGEVFGCAGGPEISYPEVVQGVTHFMHMGRTFHLWAT